MFWHDFTTNPTIHGIYVGAKTIFILVDIALAAGFVYAFNKALHYRPHFSLHPPRKQSRQLLVRNAVFRDRWGITVQRFNQGTPEAVRTALIEADAIADGVLKELGLSGEHMADRLEQLSAEDLQSLGSLWKAHRIRNNIVHSPGYELPASEAEQTMKGYEAFFKEVGVIE